MEEAVPVSIFLDLCGVGKRKAYLCSLIMKDTGKVLKCCKESGIRIEE